MHGQGSLVSDMTMHEDFYSKFCFIYYVAFCGFLLRVNMYDKKYDIGKWEKQNILKTNKNINFDFSKNVKRSTNFIFN